MNAPFRISGGLLSLAIAASAAGQAQPSRTVQPEAVVVIENSTIQYYPVHGHTRQELQLSMKKNGPFNATVQTRVYAEINWSYRSKVHYTRDGAKCRLNRFVVSLVSTITMPQWMDAATAPAEMRALWPTMLDKIRQHEFGHKAISREGAYVLSRRLQALPAYATCEALGKAIQQESALTTGEYKLANQDFDRREALKDSPFKR